MSTPPYLPSPAAGEQQPGGGPTYATAAAVAGLAREVEALRRGVAQLADLSGRMDKLAGLVARLAEQAAAAARQDRGGPALTWLDFPDRAPAGSGGGRAGAEAQVVLVRLIGWMGGVFLRYADAVRVLPGCWLWHPEVVEELLWLHQAWLAAYADPDAPVSAAGDWHDRQRPGVVRRIRDYAGTCSVELHQAGGELHRPAPAAPLADAAEAIVGWWATRRTDPPPVPTAEQVADATPVRPLRGRR